MNIISAQDIEIYTGAGLWGDNPESHSLDGLLRGQASNNPDKIALVDAPDRKQWTTGAPRTLTYKELNQEVEFLSGFLKGLNLAAGSVVAIAMGNTTNSYVAALAVHRAGFIAAPIPLYWAREETMMYLDNVQARVIITCDVLEDLQVALMCREIAQQLFNIRYVFGFGDNLPDGVVNLERILQMAELGETEVTADELPSPNAVACIHPQEFNTTGKTGTISRSSNHLLATYNVLADSLPETENPILPFSISGIVGFSFGLIGILRGDYTLHLHHYRADELLNRQIGDVSSNLAFLPAGLSGIVEDEAVTLALVHKNTQLERARYPDRTIVDVTVLNESAVFAESRPSGQDIAAGLPLAQSVTAPTLISLGLKGINVSEVGKDLHKRGGDIHISGASIPAQSLDPAYELENDRDVSIVQLGLSGSLSNDDDTRISPVGFSSEVVDVNGISFSGAKLDAIYKQVPGVVDAAYVLNPIDNDIYAVVVPDYNTSITTDTFHDGLKELGYSDLISPVGVYVTNTIQRGIGGIVLRGSLLPPEELSATGLRQAG